jgi:pyruvate kinase
VTEMAETGAGAALKEGFAKPGQRVILIAGVPFGTPGSTNMIRIAFVNADAKV